MISKYSWDLSWLLGLGMFKPSWPVKDFPVRVFSSENLGKGSSFQPQLVLPYCEHWAVTCYKTLNSRNSRSVPF